MRMRWIPITKFISNLGLYEGPTDFLRARSFMEEAPSRLSNS
jgi:hypothetical protein